MKILGMEAGEKGESLLILVGAGLNEILLFSDPPMFYIDTVMTNKS